MSDSEKILLDLSRKPGVLGTLVTTRDGVPIRSDFPPDATDLYSALVAHFVQRTRKALEEIPETGAPEVIRIRSKKNELIIAPQGEFIFIAVQDPVSVIAKK
jgi:dynein light chain roadblock-type